MTMMSDELINGGEKLSNAAVLFEQLNWPYIALQRPTLIANCHLTYPHNGYHERLRCVDVACCPLAC